jgi:very-short-patch-repair endonuclease
VRGRTYTTKAYMNARALRRELTEEELILWRALRGRRLGGAKFRKQQALGPFVGDFVSHAHKLIVEADGSQHIDSGYDQQRDAYLRSIG